MDSVKATSAGEGERERLVHPQAGPAAALAALSFLIGTFRGEGWFGATHSRVEKRVRGFWTAGGRHLALDMTTDYILGDGRIDRHAALVVVSERGGALRARAYNDSGGMTDYTIEAGAEGLTFPDRVPHGTRAVSARKRLTATETGYEEALEIDRGDGRFVVHSVVALGR